MENLPRGYRNNNPLNLKIRTKGNPWVGVIPKEKNTDGTFEQFTDMVYGYRAAMVLLRNYTILYGLRTIAQIICRFAPEPENNTERYIERVCKITGFDRNEEYRARDEKMVKSVIYAMAIVENGTNPMPLQCDIDEAWILYHN